VFRIDAALIDRLGQVQEVLRERRFNRFDSASVSELRVDRAASRPRSKSWKGRMAGAAPNG
jgi:hypothetical protein